MYGFTFNKQKFKKQKQKNKWLIETVIRWSLAISSCVFIFEN